MKLEDLTRRLESVEAERYAFFQEDIFDLIQHVWKKSSITSKEGPQRQNFNEGVCMKSTNIQDDK